MQAPGSEKTLFEGVLRWCAVAHDAAVPDFEAAAWVNVATALRLNASGEPLLAVTKITKADAAEDKKDARGGSHAQSHNLWCAPLAPVPTPGTAPVFLAPSRSCPLCFASPLFFATSLLVSYISCFFLMRTPL